MTQELKAFKFTLFLNILLFVLSTFSSCLSENTSVTVSQKNAEVLNEYSIGLPSEFIADSSTTFTLELTYTDGGVSYDSSKLTQSSTGTSECASITANEDQTTRNVSLTLSNCTGNGRLTFSYNGASSHPVLITNSSGTGFASTFAIELSSDEKTAYFVDSNLSALFSIDLSTGIRTIIRDASTGSGETLSTPVDLALSADETTAYIVSNGSDTIHAVTLATGATSIISSSVVGTGTSLSNPIRLLLNSAEDTLYVSDRGLSQVAEIAVSSGNRTWLTGSFAIAYGMIFNQNESSIYLAERSNHTLYEFDYSTPTRTLLVDNPGGEDYPFSTPHDLVLDPLDSNYVYVSNAGGKQVIKVNLSTGEKSLISSSERGDGPAITSPLGMTINSAGTKIYLADVSSTIEGILEVDIATGDRVFISRSL